MNVSAQFEITRCRVHVALALGLLSMLPASTVCAQQLGSSARESRPVSRAPDGPSVNPGQYEPSGRLVFKSTEAVPSENIVPPEYESISPIILENQPECAPWEIEAQPRCGVYCDANCPSHGRSWKDGELIPWQLFGHGEYIGPARLAAVPEYRLRVDDKLEFVFRITEVPTDVPYRLVVGDTLRIQSLMTDNVDREVTVQPDGNISVLLLGQVTAASRTIEELTNDLNKRYKRFIREPEISITPVKLNTQLQEFRATVDARAGQGGQSRNARVTPEGTIQLPSIGSAPAQGLTLSELKWEIEQRYLPIIRGIEVTPVLVERAPRYIFVVGEVRTSGRYTLEGPTSAMQAIALAGGWNNGGNLRQIVVFRRDDRWQLMATKLNVRPALYGKRPCPADDIWLRDSDILLVPKTPLLVADDAINLLFTRGLYSVLPVSASFAFLSDLSRTGGAIVIP